MKNLIIVSFLFLLAGCPTATDPRIGGLMEGCRQPESRECEELKRVAYDTGEGWRYDGHMRYLREQARDEERQKRIEQSERTIRTSQDPEEVRAARENIQSIKSQQRKEDRDARRREAAREREAWGHTLNYESWEGSDAPTQVIEPRQVGCKPNEQVYHYQTEDGYWHDMCYTPVGPNPDATPCTRNDGSGYGCAGTAR